MNLATLRPLLCFLLTAPVLTAEPFVPKDPNQPLEQLRATAFDPLPHDLRRLRAQLSSDPANAAVAAQLARRCIEAYRSASDPRYLGRAQSALAPWWTAPSAPAPILVLRASIKQSQHDFTNALSDLDAALRLDPRNPQAWLTRATILTVLGDDNEARRSCLRLAQLAPGLIALTAAANVACLNGEADRGCLLLRGALAGNPSAPAAEKLWALTTLAETCERLGRPADAQSYYEQALALGQRDPYLLGAYADFLIDSRRPEQAASLLKNETRADGLLLRLAIAESMLRPVPDEYALHVAALRARFEAGHLRGDFVHQREEARFDLCLLHDASGALKLARANWQIQHEPADARILLEAATAAGQPAAAQPVRDFIHATHLQDIALQ